MSAKVLQGQWPTKTPELVLIPDGVYTVAFSRYVIASRFGRGSLELWFKVTVFGPHFGQLVARYYKVQREGKRSFRAAPQSAFNREFAAVLGYRAPAGIAAVNCFREISIKAKVRAVTKDHRQKNLPEACRYSVIDALVERTT